MEENATFKVGKFTVHVDYDEAGGEVSNSIHVSATANGKSYWSDISELLCQSSSSKSVYLDEDKHDLSAFSPLKLTPAQWKRVDQWLTAEEHY
jgi:hypothetical protein